MSRPGRRRGRGCGREIRVSRETRGLQGDFGTRDTRGTGSSRKTRETVGVGRQGVTGRPWRRGPGRQGGSRETREVVDQGDQGDWG